MFIALLVAVLIVVGATVAIRARVHDSASPKRGASVSGPSTPIVALTTPPTTSRAVVPTAQATSVASFGADGRGRTDDTAAFGAAMTAALASPGRFAKGPSGAPQAVVRVPGGVYRIFHLHFQSNIRLEVDAGAVLEQAGNRALKASQNGGGPSFIVWDGPPGHALTNVSIVGVGSASTPLKRAAVIFVEPGWNLNQSFTFDLNTRRTGGDNFNSAMQLANVNGFLIDNVFSIQNGTPADARDPVTGYPPPTSARAAIVLVPLRASAIGGPYYDPHNGTIRNHYNIGGPFGYGANQVTSGHNLRFFYIYSRGGTALRMETDATLHKGFGGELRGVVADRIVGVNCNRAVSFAPHAQQNSDVHVSNVIARRCNQGVIESLDENLAPSQRGAFTNSSISDVQVVGGIGAQVPVAGHPGFWFIGRSTQAFARDAGATWSVVISRPTCSGAFAQGPNPINMDGTTGRPTCH